MWQTGENKINKKRKGAKELPRVLAMLLAAASPVVAMTLVNPTEGLVVDFSMTSDGRLSVTANVLWTLNFTGLVISTGQPGFNAPTLLDAQFNGQTEGGWQSLSLGNGLWGIVNPYITNSSMSGQLAQTPFQITRVFVFSDQYGGMLAPNQNWLVNLYFQTQLGQFQSNGFDAPEPGTVWLVAAGLLLAVVIRRR